MLVLTLPILISPLITLADAFSMSTFFNFKESNFTCEFRKGEDEVGSNIEFRGTAHGIGGSEVLTAGNNALFGRKRTNRHDNEFSLSDSGGY